MDPLNTTQNTPPISRPDADGLIHRGSHPNVTIPTKLATETPNLSDNTDAIAQNHWLADTPIGDKAKNLKSSLLAFKEGLHILGNLVIDRILDAKGIDKLSVIGTSLGIGVLYGLNLLVAAILKAAVWLPILATSASFGLVGGVLGGILSLGNKEAMKTGVIAGSTIPDWILSNTLCIVGLFSTSWLQPLVMYPALFLLKLTQKTRNEAEESLVLNQLKVVIDKMAILEPASIRYASSPFGILNSYVSYPHKMVDALRFLHTVHDLNAIAANGNPALICDESGKLRNKITLKFFAEGLLKADLIPELDKNTFDCLLRELQSPGINLNENLIKSLKKARDKNSIT